MNMNIKVLNEWIKKSVKIDSTLYVNADFIKYKIDKYKNAFEILDIINNSKNIVVDDEFTSAINIVKQVFIDIECGNKFSKTGFGADLHKDIGYPLKPRYLAIIKDKGIYLKNRNNGNLLKWPLNKKDAKIFLESDDFSKDYDVIFNNYCINFEEEFLGNNVCPSNLFGKNNRYIKIKISNNDNAKNVHDVKEYMFVYKKDIIKNDRYIIYCSKTTYRHKDEKSKVIETKQFVEDILQVKVKSGEIERYEQTM